MFVFIVYSFAITKSIYQRDIFNMEHKRGSGNKKI